MQAFIASYIDKPRASNREIEDEIRKRWPGFYFRVNKDIKNLRYRQRRAQLAGYTPIQALMKDLDNRGVKYTVKWVDNIVDGKPLGFFLDYAMDRRDVEEVPQGPAL